ncbi:UDP-N-acetylmuramate dehydrogenase [Pseudidiomarina marina]|uniref:UDP-N-acetylenolpyruvoylglucosamine reductase n=1 Tax=Pseudidiomarina marina TaxID=502366 RepID=A0A432YIM6_9GAMM|nr:UDP-N-acetylmuramate dehydrogenase [Pseudidiomarina marina]RUO60715.1 UDP-N-acetylenolpyruvoylglucosamine reductase [Pseudidiomarina marina]
MSETKISTDLSTLHTFRLPAKAQDIIFLDSQEQVNDIPSDAYILGGGSNTIFLTDFKKPIVCVRVKGIKVRQAKEHWSVKVGAGEDWHNLVLFLNKKGIHGLENLALIPGTVGAAPVQNIGAYGREVSDFIDYVQVWDRQERKLVNVSTVDCQFGYRDSIFKQYPMRWVILEVHFLIPKLWQPELSYGELKALNQPVSATDILNKVIAIRTAKLPDPKVIPNAGSFFKNPVISRSKYSELIERFPTMPYFELATGEIKLAAGWLIDHLNLKGFKIGGAAVHMQQALVLINSGGATGADVVKLARHILSVVYENYGIELEAEVRLLDEKGLVSL